MINLNVHSGKMVNYYLYGILGAIAIGLLFSVKIVNQYERGVKFRLGKYVGLMTPGINIVIPLIENYTTVDTRQASVELEPQEVLTSDQVNLRIDGIVFYSIEEPEKAILNIQDLKYQLENVAKVELKEIIGKRTMKESLSQREEIAKDLMSKLTATTSDSAGGTNKKDYGVVIKSVQINNIELPKELIRAMSKQAEAEREKEARVTKALGEFEAARKFKEASDVYKGNFEAMRLRELQTYQEIGTEHNTLMMVIPSAMANPQGSWVLGHVKDLDKKDPKEKKE